MSKLHSNQSVTYFKCDMCDIVFEKTDNFNMEDYQELSKKMKVHEQAHDYHNEYITERRDCSA